MEKQTKPEMFSPTLAKFNYFIQLKPSLQN
jgi:hypothetical protein